MNINIDVPVFKFYTIYAQIRFFAVTVKDESSVIGMGRIVGNGVTFIFKM